MAPKGKNTAEAYRHEPFDIDVEQALLGSLLANNDLIDAASGILDPEHFYDPLHGRVYEMIVQLRLEGAINIPILFACMKSDPGVIETGGMEYFEALRGAAPSIPQIGTYTKILREHAGRREMIRLGESLVNAAYEPPTATNQVAAMADWAGESLFKIGSMGTIGASTLKPLSEFAQEAVRRTEEAIHTPEKAYLTTGLETVDEACGPLFRGDVTVLGGATSMAKTALAQKAAMANALRGHVVGFWSLEMGGSQLATRYLSQKIRISSDRLRRGKVSSAEFEAMTLSSQGDFLDLPLFIDDRPSQSVAQMRAQCSYLIKKYGKIDLGVFDHLQFIQPADSRAEERDQLRQITKDLKTLAKDFNMAILLLSHITKENERRVTKRPVLADLYGSSGIQQNADAVMFVYREHYYLTREKPAMDKGDEALTKWMAATDRANGWAEVFTDKNRMGKIGTARVKFTDHLTEFSDPDDGPVDPQIAMELQRDERPFG